MIKIFKLLPIILLATTPLMGDVCVGVGVIEGFGSTTPGGTGQTIYHVTNLNNTGAGSLRDAVSASNRYIVFDVGGTITSAGNYNLTALSFITVDGTTAPSPGITVTGGGGFLIEDLSHDIVIKNIRFQNSTDDNFHVFNSHDIVFDHISSRGDTDGALDITQDSYNVTVQNSIFVDQSTGAGAMLVKYNTNRVSIHHNLFNGWFRNPLMSGADGVTTSTFLGADIRNNIMWNWGATGGTAYGTGVEVDHGAKANIINNYFKSSGSYSGLSALGIELNHNGSGAQAYTSGNVSGNSINFNTYGNVGSAFTAASVTTQTACVAAAKVLQDAGAKPLNSADTSLIASITLTGC